MPDHELKEKMKIGQTIRSTLQLREFENWCKLPHKGKGVELFKEVTSANKWVFSKKGLSSSEWTTALKMVANVVPVRSVPGRSQDGTRCRHCSEPETLAHVLGSCPYGALLRNSRHHSVRTIIATALRNKGWQVVEEVHCIAESGSNRRLDILCFNTKSKEGFVIDPTIRFEVSSDQPKLVDEEKKSIYEPCVKYLKEKYNLNDVSVHGLMIGARGTIPKRFEHFRKKFN